MTSADLEPFALLRPQLSWCWDDRCDSSTTALEASGFSESRVKDNDIGFDWLFSVRCLPHKGYALVFKMPSVSLESGPQERHTLVTLPLPPPLTPAPDKLFPSDLSKPSLSRYILAAQGMHV